MNEQDDVPTTVIRYLNRLSDYLFVAARIVNARLSIQDNEYVRGTKVFHTEKKKKGE